jgi:hypothetical protein
VSCALHRVAAEAPSAVSSYLVDLYMSATSIIDPQIDYGHSMNGVLTLAVISM